MFHYKAFGLEITSEIELPGMIPGSSNSDVRIIRGEVNPSQLTHMDVEGHNYRVSGEEVYLWWNDIGMVKISKGEQITVDAITDLESSHETNLIPFLLGPAMALLLHQRGFLVLHGSSVKFQGVATAFLGYRGNGKSTTAIHLYQEGYPLVTDDILAIKFNKEERPMVYPGYPHVRLNKDSYNQVKEITDILTPIRTIAGKVFCDASNGFSSEPVYLEMVYVIEKGGKMEISTLKSQDNLFDLIRHSVANRIFQHTTQKENLIRCAQLVNNVNVKRLEISHSFGRIQELVKMIEVDLEKVD